MEMLRIRRFEESAARAYTQGKISGFLHLYIGQEAIAVATASNMKPGDRVVTTYRDHGFAIALGCDPNACMAELYGKATGLVGGVGGSMHFFAKDKGLWGGYAIVGSHVPVAAGHAFASKYNGDGAVTLCFLGEGAMHIGATAEGMNLAGLWKLPIVFVIENNMYAMGTPLNRQSPVEDLTIRAPGWALASDRFIVQDVRETRQRLGEAMEHARNNQRPALVELLTYRFRGHSMSDPGKYRTKDEIETWRARDPLHRAEQELRAAGYGDAELEAIDEAVIAEMDAAMSFADESPQPDPEHRFRHQLIED
ncbi:MAG: pyruvate dehydrogenase (acetyl-transferring) E1 component subunit alpha [Deltaproteobacteria bacterium]|nr:pyruvate dehydrogenase (acetyl-transferring) E1 component subunit alpha [Nannocystaceae bacterium]